MDANVTSWASTWADLGTAERTPARMPVTPVTQLTAVLARVVRASLEPTWSPVLAADSLAASARTDVCVLRMARARLRRLDRQRPTLVAARSIATLNLAITRMEDGYHACATDGG